MLSGVSIICFAASYSVAFALELTRPLFRSGVRGAIMLGFAAAGLFAHTVYLYYRAAHATGSPLSSERDWYLVTAWLLVAIYLYLTCYRPGTAFGLFLLPLVLGLVAVGRFLADTEPYARQSASKVWGIVHGTSILMATISVLVGFVAGLMYLEQTRRLKNKRPLTRGPRLPSLEWLRQINSRAIVVSTLMLAVGVLSGVVLDLINRDGRVPWYDPVVLSTMVMFVWLVVALSVSVFYKPARGGRKVVYLTVISFVFLLVMLGMMLFFDTRHGGGTLGQEGSYHKTVGCVQRTKTTFRETASGCRLPAEGGGLA